MPCGCPTGCGSWSSMPLRGRSAFGNESFALVQATFSCSGREILAGACEIGSVGAFWQPGPLQGTLRGIGSESGSIAAASASGIAC